MAGELGHRNQNMPAARKSVKALTARGIHGRFDLYQEFHEGINILHGKNGTGKTTVLHILANLLNGDFRRFAFLNFSFIELELSDGSKVALSKCIEDGDSCIRIDKGEFFPDFISIIKAKEALRPGPMGSDTPVPEQRRILESTYSSLHPIIPTAYFPAFRTLIEAAGRHDGLDPYYAARMGRSSRNQPLFTSTTFSRRFFGDFVPWINYPSPYEVGQRISSEALQALNDVSSTDRALLSKAFLEIFSTLSSSGTSARQHDNPDAILSAIKDLSEQLSILGISNGPSSDEQVYSTLRTMIPSVQFREGLEEVYAPVLQIYREALEERVRVQNSSSSLIRLYLDSVNNFLEGKRLSIRRRDDIPIPLVQVEFEDNTFGNIQSLSSGERQIVTIIYASTHMSGQEVVLIDEPEISLHIDWQIKLLPSLSEQLNDKQIITCTHSPVIASGYEEQMVELRLTASQTQADSVIKEDDDSEELL